jgi:hypothetical protein
LNDKNELDKIYLNYLMIKKIEFTRKHSARQVKNFLIGIAGLQTLQTLQT